MKKQIALVQRDPERGQSHDRISERAGSRAAFGELSGQLSVERWGTRAESMTARSAGCLTYSPRPSGTERTA